MADRLKASGVTILNEVVLNQVLVQFGDDETTRKVIDKVQAEGTCWTGGAFWQSKQAMRIAVSNWSTTEADIDRSADAMVSCYREEPGLTAKRKRTENGDTANPQSLFPNH